MSLRAFATAHGGATAVIEHLGRRGVRVVLVGTDGAWGDHVAADVEAARAACAEAGVEVGDSWGRELSDGVRTTAAEWRRMGGARGPR